MALADKARGQRIAKLRKRRRLTQQAMAEQLRIGYRTYQTWEGGTLPEWPNLQKLADFFGVKPEYIIGEDDIAADPSFLPQMDRIEGEQRAINAKLDAILEALSPEVRNGALAGLRGQLAQVATDLEALRVDRAAADMEATRRHEEVQSALARLRGRRTG